MNGSTSSVVTTLATTTSIMSPNHIASKLYVEVFYVLIPLIAIANGLIIFLFLTNHTLRYVQANKYILAHASMDFLVGLIIIPCIITQNENVRGAMIMYSLLVSLLTLTASTFDRYVAICKPLHYERIQTDKNVRFSIIVSWGLPFFVVLLPQIWLKGSEKNFVSTPHRAFLGAVLFSIMVVLCLLIAAYVKIFKVGMLHLHNQFSFNSHVNWYGRARKEIKFARLFFSLSMTFLVFWFPTGYMSLVDNVLLRRDLMPPEWIVNLNFHWMLMYSLLDPIYYAVFHKSIRNSIKSLVTCIHNPSVVIHPITPVKCTSSSVNSNVCGMIVVQPVLTSVKD